MEKFLTFENQTQTNGKVEAQAKLKQRTRFEGQLKVPPKTSNNNNKSCELPFCGFCIWRGTPH